MSRHAADIIRYLMRTEKWSAQEAQRKYFFAVDIRATKPDIKKAVEEIFKVKVDNVNTAVMPGKPRKVRYQWGYQANWKRAIVTLSEGSKIEVAS